MKRYLWVGVVFFLSFSWSFGQSQEVRTKNFNTRKNVVLEGYDPVSYFDKKPEEGKADLQFSYQGIVYWFVSQSNLDRFKTNPAKYEPAYGGWCAYAMGETGEKVKVDPETYKIIDGRLFLFYNFWGNNTLSDWNKNEKELRIKGDQNWKKFVQ